MAGCGRYRVEKEEDLVFRDFGVQETKAVSG